MSTPRVQKIPNEPTLAEKRLWRLLFPLRTGGYHFRKQAPIGPYWADVACHHAKLVIEVDGDLHGKAAAIRHDGVRDAFLRGEGYRVLRFSNQDVIGDPEGVFALIATALEGYEPRARSVRRNADGDIS